MSASQRNGRQILDAFRQLGPYLRIEQSDHQRYFFDCLEVCLNLKHEPELREFWGWWLALTPCEQGYAMKSEFGLFSKEGIWEACTPPAKHRKGLEASRQQFLSRLETLLGKWQVSLLPVEAAPLPHVDEHPSVEPA